MTIKSVYKGPDYIIHELHDAMIATRFNTVNRLPVWSRREEEKTHTRVPGDNVREIRALFSYNWVLLLPLHLYFKTIFMEIRGHNAKQNDNFYLKQTRIKKQHDIECYQAIQ